MSNSNNEFSQTRMKKVLKSESNKRVNAEAADELGKELEDYAEAVAWKAKELAEQKGRKTVRSSDVREALNELEGEQK